MRIQHNTTALNAHRQLGGNNTAVGKNLEKLSSGFKINRAGDDAAGLAISEKMRSQIRGLETASKNASDGISLVQTAEGALTEVHSMLNRMVELSTQSANGTYAQQDRNNLQAEVDALNAEIERIATSTNFNGIDLLNGNMGGYALNTAGSTGVAAGSISAKGGNIPNAGAISVTVAGGDITGATINGQNVGTNAVAGISFEVEIIGANGNKTVSTVNQLDAITGTNANDSITIKAKVDDTTASKADADLFKGFELKFQVTGAAATVSANVTGASGLNLQIGDTASQSLNVNVNSMKTADLGTSGLKIDSEAAAKAAITTINTAIERVSTQRGALGALQNRLEHTINNLGVTTENMSAAESRIRDVDMAKEMMDFTKNNILTQAAQAMLAQANQLPQGVLQLLR